MAAREIWILFCCVETAPMDREQWRHGAAASLPTALLGLRPQQTDRFSSFTGFCFYVNHDGLVDTTSTRKFEDWQEAGKKNIKKKRKQSPTAPTHLCSLHSLCRVVWKLSRRGEDGKAGSVPVERSRSRALASPLPGSALRCSDCWKRAAVQGLMDAGSSPRLAAAWQPPSLTTSVPLGAHPLVILKQILRIYFPVICDNDFFFFFNQKSKFTPIASRSLCKGTQKWKIFICIK